MQEDTKALVASMAIGVLITVAFALLILAAAFLHTSHSTTPTHPAITTVRNVSYHGMTCTETIVNGNSYMNGCSR